MKTLHVWSQEMWHDDVYIVGDKEALRLLYHTIGSALIGLDAGENGRSSAEFFTADGEGFAVCVMPDEDMGRHALPYTHEWAVDTDERRVRPEQAWYAP